MKPNYHNRILGMVHSARSTNDLSIRANHSGNSSTANTIFLAVSSLLLATTFQASAFEYLNDTFADGERATQALPASAKWNILGGGSAAGTITGGVAANYNVVSGALRLPYAASGNSANTQLAYFTPVGQPIVLTNINDSITLSVTVTADQITSGGADAFRVGLFNSGGNRVSNDLSGTTNITDGYTGNAVSVTFPNASPTLRYQRRNTTTGSAQLFAGGASVFTSPTPAIATVGATAGVPFIVTITVTKLSATQVTVASTVNGVASSITDTAYTSFDTLSIFGSTNWVTGASGSFTIDNVTVNSNVAPPAAPNPDMKWAVGTDDWDTVTTNWVPVGGGAPLLFTNLSNVTFNDDASGTSPIFVDLTANRQPASVTVDGTKDYTFTGSSITGIGTTLVKSGSSTLTLTNSNSFTGATTLTGGTLKLSNPTALSGSGLTMNGGSLVFDSSSIPGNAFTVGGLAGASGAANDIVLENDAAAPVTLTVNSNSNTTYDAILSGAGSLVKNGSGVLTLNGGNTYTGNTTITGGTIVMKSSPDDTTNAVGLGGTVELNGNSAVLAWGSGNNTDLSSRIKLADGITPRLDGGGNNLTLATAPVLGPLKTAGFIKEGFATMTLSWESDYGGKTFVNFGILSVDSLNSVSSPLPAATSSLGKPNSVANGTIQFGNNFTNQVTLRYTGTGETTDRIIQMQGTTGGATIEQSGTGHLKFTANPTAPGAGSKPLILSGSTAGTGEFSGAIPDNSATNKTSVVKQGTGTWTLSGVSPYTGATTVNDGTLVGKVGGSSLNSPVSLSAAVGKDATFKTLVSNVTQQWSCASLTVNNLGNSSTLNFDFGTNAPSTTLAPLKVTGASTFTTTPAVTANIQVANLAAGTYPLVSMASLGGITDAPAVTIISSPRVTVDAVTTLSATGLNLVINSFTTTGPIKWTGGDGLWELDSPNNEIWIDSAPVPATTYYQALDTVVFDNTSGTGGEVTLNENLAPVGVTVNNPTAAYTITGTGSIDGINGLTKSGAAQLTLGTGNTYSGDTTNAGGTILLANQNALRNSTLRLNTGSGGISFDSAVAENAFTFGGLAAATPGAGFDISLNNTAAAGVALTVGGNDGSTTYAGVLSGAGSLTKTGAGTLTLSQANTYGGGTTLLGSGGLRVTNPGTFGSGPLLLASAGSPAGAITFEINGGIDFSKAITIDSSTGREHFAGTGGANTLSSPITINNSGNFGINFASDGGVGLPFTVSGPITAATYPGSLSLRGVSGGVLSSVVAAPAATLELLQTAADTVWTVNSTGNTWALTRFTMSANGVAPNELGFPGGRIVLGANNALSTTARIQWNTASNNIAGGTLDLAGFNQTVAGLEKPNTHPGNTANSIPNITNSSASTDSTLTIAGLTANYAYTGKITDGAARRVNLEVNAPGFTQSLTGAAGNLTYTGSTKIKLGTLSVTNPNFANSSTLTIGENAGAAAVLDLPTAGTDVVFALVIDGVPKPAGTYSLALGNADGAITGLGAIQVVTASDYDTWAGLFPGFTDNAPTADQDKDGVINQAEYAFGLNPTSGSSVNPIVQQLNKTTGKFRYTRRESPATTLLTYTVQTSSNLSTWTADATATANQSVIGTAAGVQTVEVTLTGTLPLTATPLFVRVKAD